MNDSSLFINDPYSVSQEEKEDFLLSELNKLIKLHQERCPPYAKILHFFYKDQSQYNHIADVPYLPVNLFKTQTLLSVPSDEVFKVLKSSGTTSSQSSQVYLDSATAHRQTMALANIMTSFLGQQRLPMLVLDHSNVIRDRQSYSARGAAIIGMLNFGRDVCYAFDENMNLKVQEVKEWLQKHEGQRILLFGLTFIVWDCFIKKLQSEDISISIPNGILFHTGGWKKLQDQSVNNAIFKQELQKVTNVSKCHNFYGMAEQVGSVFTECEKGYLHCPSFADIVIRDPKTWQECSVMQEGVIQVLSILPTSYPGHSLLTEDLGVVCGIDDCGCGRKGKYFEVLGRVPKAEIRGCSDTYGAMKV